jgi:KDO2-lipid IV(A) lauroyltransferase
MLGVLLYHLGSFFSRVLPGDIPQTIARILGEASWLTRVRTRRVIRDNLRRVHRNELSEAELSRCVRRTILNFARCIQIFLELPSMKWEDVRERCDFSEFLAEAEAIDGPFIVTTAHVGPWELGGYCLSRMGYRLHTVALDHPSRHVTRFFSRRRAMFGIHAYPLKHSFPRLVSAIEAGDCVALIVDRAYGNARQRATFFGVTRDFPLGHAILSVRTGAPVMVGAIVLDGYGRFRYVHGGTHRPDPGLEEPERIGRLQQACLSDLEPIVRRHSDQWFHFRRLEARGGRGGA